MDDIHVKLIVGDYPIYRNVVFAGAFHADIVTVVEPEEFLEFAQAAGESRKPFMFGKRDFPVLEFGDNGDDETFMHIYTATAFFHA
jgi:anthranilate phosphoribosyltransferase